MIINDELSPETFIYDVTDQGAISAVFEADPGVPTTPFVVNDPLASTTFISNVMGSGSLLAIFELDPTPTVNPFISLVRRFTKDHEGLNRLLNYQQECDDEQLLLYLNMALNHFNMIPPFSVTWTMGNFPYPTLLIYQAVIEKLMSNGILNSRNELQYNNGGVTVQIPDGSKYINHINLLLSQVSMATRSLTQYKIKVNLERAYGRISSPYANLESCLTYHSLYM